MNPIQHSARPTPKPDDARLAVIHRCHSQAQAGWLLDAVAAGKPSVNDGDTIILAWPGATLHARQQIESRCIGLGLDVLVEVEA